ncbi:MAG: hypothetical protein ICV73_24575 [Acetobacteraceae bacterium]|nr:hypothetical protein [Acetobacteraceae bacterium]
MPRSRPSLTRLLALLLLAQWATAFAHCFAPLAAAADAHGVEICTADGLLTVVVGEDGQPVPPQRAAHRPACPDCGGPAALEPPSPPGAAAPVVWGYVAPARPSEGLPVAPARAPPQQPRAPPFA